MIEKMEKFVQLLSSFIARVLRDHFVVGIKEASAHSKQPRNAQVVLVVTIEAARIKYSCTRNDERLRSGTRVVPVPHSPAFPSACAAFPDQRSP